MDGRAARRHRVRPTRPAVVRSALFAVAFVVAVAVGRRTVMDGTSLSLVWPAAGVAAVWFTAQRQAGTRWLDVGALAVATFVINAMTGATPVLAACFVVANLVQVGVFTALLRHWCPDLWGAGGHRPLARVRDLWRLLSAAAVGAAAGAVFGPTAVGVVTGHWSLLATVVWLTRNTASVMLIGVAGLRVGALLAARTRGADASTPAGARWRTPAGAAELVTVLTVSAAAYGVTFGLLHGLPLAFLLIVLTVWVAVRFDTTFAALHDLVVGTAAVLLTLGGSGPFAAIDSDAVRALVVQAFILVTAVTGLSLALFRDERDELVATVEAQRVRADDQARLLSAVLESLQEGLVVVGPDGRVLLRNAAAVGLLGASARSGRVEDPSHYGLHHVDGRPVEPHESAPRRALAGERVRGERRLVRHAGAPEGRVLSVNAAPLPPRAGETSGGAVVVYHDVTQEHTHEAELDAFARVVAHDLRSPLTGLLGWVELAQETATEELPDSPAREGLQMALGRAARSVRQMDRLIGDLLEHTTVRQAQLQRTSVHLREVLPEVLGHYGAPTAGSLVPAPRIAVDLPPDLDAVCADPVLLRHLLGNLVGNAVKYVHPGAGAEVTVSATAADGWVEVSVADRGIGIPAGQHEAVFADFHRAHTGYSGTGLGLSLCRRIVERHGGRITAGDNPGGGTRIAFTLRVAPADERRAGADAARRA